MVRSLEPSSKTKLTLPSVTAVSSGVVLRAANKDKGSTRRAQSSYGFLRREPQQKMLYKGHKRTQAEFDEMDGENYLEVINYFMTKVGEVETSVDVE